MEALRAGEQPSDPISHSLPALISYVGRDLLYQTCNEAYLKWFNLSREEIIGKSVWEVLGEEAWAEVRPHMEAGFAGQTV